MLNEKEMTIVVSTIDSLVATILANFSKIRELFSSEANFNEEMQKLESQEFGDKSDFVGDIPAVLNNEKFHFFWGGLSEEVDGNILSQLVEHSPSSQRMWTPIAILALRRAMGQNKELASFVKASMLGAIAHRPETWKDCRFHRELKDMF
jgi:hypothetical protein